LQAELAKVEAVAAGHRADFERERERADRLMTELLQATAATMESKEAVARLEGGMALLRQELLDIRSDRDAWRAEVQRLIQYRFDERERLTWWKRPSGKRQEPRPSYELARRESSFDTPGCSLTAS
jgi:hypothetical protein